MSIMYSLVDVVFFLAGVVTGVMVSIALTGQKRSRNRKVTLSRQFPFRSHSLFF